MSEKDENLQDALAPEAPPEGDVKDKGDQSPAPPADDTDNTPVSREELAKILGEKENTWQTERKNILDGHKGTVDKLRKDLKEAQDKAKKFEVDTFLKEVEERGGDVEKAKKQISERQSFEDERAALTEERNQFNEQVKRINEAAKKQQAEKLSKETGIPLKDLEECNSPQEMELRALRFKMEKLESNSVPPKKVPQGGSPPGTFDDSQLSWYDRARAFFSEQSQK